MVSFKLSYESPRFDEEHLYVTHSLLLDMSPKADSTFENMPEDGQAPDDAWG